jgi:hypothetical protein
MPFSRPGGTRDQRHSPLPTMHGCRDDAVVSHTAAPRSRRRVVRGWGLAEPQRRRRARRLVGGLHPRPLVIEVPNTCSTWSPVPAIIQRCGPPVRAGAADPVAGRAAVRPSSPDPGGCPDGADRAAGRAGSTRRCDGEAAGHLERVAPEPRSRCRKHTARGRFHLFARPCQVAGFAAEPS